MREFHPLSDNKKRRLAIANILFVTFLLVVAWLIPMFTRDWHVKRWFIGLGLAGKIQLEFGLLSYNVDLKCHLVEGVCEKLGEYDFGHHSYFDLADRMCNFQHMFSSALFRGCSPLHSLTYTSLGTFVVLCLALWCFLMGAALIVLYINGYASKKLYNWIVAFYIAAPTLQTLAVCVYTAVTFDMRRFMDFGIIEEYKSIKMVAGSSHVVTFSMSTIGAACLCAVSAIPLLLITQCVGRDKTYWKDTEEEAWEAERLMYATAASGYYVEDGVGPERRPYAY